MNEVEAVARAVAPMKEGGREFDQMPPTRLELRQWSRSGMCSTNDATQDDATELAQAAIAALDAARGDAEPVAWLYTKSEASYVHKLRLKYSGAFYYGKGWAETPLYAHPPRGDQVARFVAHMKTFQPDEDVAECPATWGDFLQILEVEAEAWEPFNG